MFLFTHSRTRYAGHRSRGTRGETDPGKMDPVDLTPMMLPPTECDFVTLMLLMTCCIVTTFGLKGHFFFFMRKSRFSARLTLFSGEDCMFSIQLRIFGSLRNRYDTRFML